MKMTKILIYIKMLKMILFHHHSSIQDKDWSKPALGGCAQILVLYTTNVQIFLAVRACKSACKNLCPICKLCTE